MSDRGSAWTVTLTKPRGVGESAAQWEESFPVHSRWEVEALSSAFRVEGLLHDWDSYGSPAPTVAALNACYEFLRKLANMGFGDLPLPQVVPVPGGGVQLEWRHGRREVEIEILPGGALEFLRVEDGEPRDEEVTGTVQLPPLFAWLTSAT